MSKKQKKRKFFKCVIRRYYIKNHNNIYSVVVCKINKNNNMWFYKKMFLFSSYQCRFFGFFVRILHWHLYHLVFFVLVFLWFLCVLCWVGVGSFLCLVFTSTGSPFFTEAIEFVFLLRLFNEKLII